MESKYYDRPLGNLDKIVDRWQKDGQRPYDRAMPIKVPTGELWKHREYTWERENARRSPEEWDALVKLMKKGWREQDPLLLFIGRKGGVKVGEGNHRLAIARVLKISQIPVRIVFYEGKVEKTDLNKARQQQKVREKKVTKTVTKEPDKPLSPEAEKQVDALMDLLFKR